ncbi:phosphate transport system regulatory protein PhoU, partial [Candidatus Aerophobetes bacterium]|nr:phosphate transport system regulatory protein PhoU [Candidatus Aerophobetes bacterium]
MLKEKIIFLKKELIEYATMVENMIEKSMEGLLKREDKVLRNLIEVEEPKANEMEIQLDEMCTTIIAQYEPRAGDLRTVLMILKMNNDLERMADHAVNIAQSSLFLIERPPVKPLIDLPT